MDITYNIIFFALPVVLALIIGRWIAKQEVKSKAWSLLSISLGITVLIWIISMFVVSIINQNEYKGTVLLQMAFSPPFFVFALMLIFSFFGFLQQNQTFKKIVLIGGAISSVAVAIFFPYFSIFS